MTTIPQQQLCNNYYFVFILGMLAWYPSMAPSVISEKSLNMRYTDWHQMITYLPFLYGIVNVIVFYLINTYFPNYANYYVAGVIMALFYSGLGRATGHAHKYGLGNINMLHVYAIMMYVPLYGVVFGFLDSKINCNH